MSKRLLVTAPRPATLKVPGDPHKRPTSEHNRTGDCPATKATEINRGQKCDRSQNGTNSHGGVVTSETVERRKIKFK